MKIKLNWALFLLTASSYIFYPVWHLPLPRPAQWALLNLFILLSAFALYSPLEEVSVDASLSELKGLWPVIFIAAALCLPFWLMPIPTGSDEQSHAGPAAWLLGKGASALGLDMRLLPLFFLPAAALAAAAAFKLFKKGINLPGKKISIFSLAVAGNAFFFASLRFGLAEAIGRFETVLRYPPLSKFLYLPAYLLFGVHEAVPRAVQFGFLLLAAVYILRVLKLFKIEPPVRLTFLLIVFFPTFFNLTTTAELEAGTVFFFCAAIYHFMKAAATGDRKQFLKCAFWTAAGLFYKQLLLGLMLSFIPVLAAFWYIYPQRRSDWAYGLKTLAIPAAVGMPFILLSAILKIRDAALVYSNLIDPGLMLLDIKNIYQTAGAAITGLLVISVAAGIYRHKGRELALLGYFAVTYYIMISATAAVGYIRHAQPFYITLVILLALWAAELARSRPAIKAPLYTVLLTILIFQSVLAENPYQRRTLFNFKLYCFPYWEVSDYLKTYTSRLKVYAPMEVEPSHFYLAKAGLAGKIDWDRTYTPGFSAEKTANACAAQRCDFMLLPYSPFDGIAHNFITTADRLIASGKFRRDKIFNYGGNKLVLLKPCAE
ncbi:MAG: hypothetical protein AUJ51_02640 [Elusimicrobia bacterium CG1_02_56_21]|nr:MAG: hypothetical protein AUJ51_02640 [Elusimicrobia bacterium CG1_02_56_21]